MQFTSVLLVVTHDDVYELSLTVECMVSFIVAFLVEAFFTCSSCTSGLIVVP